MSRDKTKLFKILLNRDNQEKYALVAAFNKNQAIKRVDDILNINSGFITDVLEVNTGETELLLATEIIDLLLEKNCKSYMNFISANQINYLNENNLESIKKAKYKLKE